MPSEEFDRFIEAWGSMGVLWGINRSMARIHALLLLAEEPVDSDEIARRLNISRGNVSMCLKELRTWGVVERVNVSGDRRDFYRVEPDAWKMLYRIAVGRKEREFDPALHSLRHLLSEADLKRRPKVQARLSEVEDTLTTLDRMAGRFLTTENKSRAVLEFFRYFSPK